jgi:hypothetical protein
MSETEIVTDTEALVSEPVKPPTDPRRRVVIAAGAAISALRAWLRSPVTWAAAVIVAVVVAAALLFAPRGETVGQPAVAEGRVQIPSEHRAAADAAAAKFKNFRWVDGCHEYVRTHRGAVYWVAPGGTPNINTWEVGRRGWPKAGCKTPDYPAAEPCDAKGVPVCGVAGGYQPGITDGEWQDVSAGGVPA